MSLLIMGLPVPLRPWFRPASEAEAIFIDSSKTAEALRVPNKAEPVSFQLAGDISLVHQFLLPKEALRDVKNAVRLEVERAMPVASGDLLYAFEVGDVATDDMIVVTIYAARKRLIEKLISLAEQAGRVVEDVIFHSGTENHQVRLPLSRLRRRKWMRVAAIVLLAVTMVAILSYFPQIYAGRLEKAIAETDAAVRDLRQKTNKIAGLQRQVHAMQTLSQAVYSQRESAQILDLFVKLTEASPDSVAFEELRLDGKRLFIRGTAHSPEDWVLQLQENSAFQDVALESVLGANQEGKRRFEIRMDAIWPAKRREEINE